MGRIRVGVRLRNKDIELVFNHVKMEKKYYCLEVNIGPGERKQISPEESADKLRRLVISTIEEMKLDAKSVAPQLDISRGGYEPYDFLVTMKGSELADKMKSEINKLKGYVAKFGKVL
jgi:hypothetical protein